MKLRFVALIFFTLFIVGAAPTFAQTVKTAPTPSNILTSSKDGQTTIETVSMRVKLTLRDREVPELKLYLAVTATLSASRVGATPERVTLYFRNMSAPNLTLAVRSDRLLWFVVDGEQVLLGHMEREDLRDIGGIDGIIELLEVTVPYDNFLKLANGKQVIGRLGSLAFELGEGQRNIFREFIKAVTAKQ